MNLVCVFMNSNKTEVKNETIMEKSRECTYKIATVRAAEN